VKHAISLLNGSAYVLHSLYLTQMSGVGTSCLSPTALVTLDQLSHIEVAVVVPNSTS